MEMLLYELLKYTLCLRSTYVDCVKGLSICWCSRLLQLCLIWCILVFVFDFLCVGLFLSCRKCFVCCFSFCCLKSEFIGVGLNRRGGRQSSWDKHKGAEGALLWGVEEEGRGEGRGERAGGWVRGTLAPCALLPPAPALPRHNPPPPPLQPPPPHQRFSHHNPLFEVIFKTYNRWLHCLYNNSLHLTCNLPTVHYSPHCKSKVNVPTTVTTTTTIHTTATTTVPLQQPPVSISHDLHINTAI